jgi:hypothetical protein
MMKHARCGGGLKTQLVGKRHVGVYRCEKCGATVRIGTHIAGSGEGYVKKQLRKL